MARGFLSGALVGGVVSLGLGGVASVLAPPPILPQTPPIADTAPQETQAPQVADAPANAPVVEEADKPRQSDAPRTEQPATETGEAVAEATLEPAGAPQTGEASELAPPADAPQTGSVNLSEEDPVFPNPQALAPMMPQEADRVDLSTDPAPLPQPEQAGTQSEPSQDAAAAEAESPAQPAADAPEEGADSAQEPAIVAVDPPPSVLRPAPETDDDAPTDEGNAEDEAPQVAMIAPSARPRIGTPAVTLTERGGGVTVNRPAVAEGTDPSGGETIIREEGAAANANTRPITQFAQTFSNPDEKPLMGIVLIDDGSGPTTGQAGIAALRSFPYTLSFAVDSSLPDAGDRMALYRAEGFEVLALVDLPEGAQPSDVETTFGAVLPQMTEVVGVLEGTGAGLQGSRTVSDQVTAVLAQSGHGLVTQSKGLNTMPNLARKEGVPAQAIFRDFDSKGQDAQVIRRFLDQAAFKAGQEGAVIMLGRLRPDTISALLLWGLQDRAGQVALAPISAVLRQAME